MHRTLLATVAIVTACQHAPPTGPASAVTPSGPAEALRDEALSGSRAHQWAQSLADLGPRLTGSAGDARAVEWAVRTMKELGLANVRAEKVTSPRWERGAESGQLVAPTAQPLALTALGGSIGTAPGGLEAELVEFPSLEALQKSSPAAATGKIAFINQPMERSRDGEGYGKAVPGRFAGPTEAARHGAVGLLIRSVSASMARFPHTGAMRYGDGVTQVPAAALAVPDAELLHRLLVSGASVKVRVTLGCHAGPDAQTANVVGEVVGRARPEEVVLLGAHLDSWDLGPGAVDDAAGVGVVLEAGRLLAKAPQHPRRTVRVVLFANEENGLAGAKVYALAHAAELDKHVLASETDTGTGKVFRFTYRAGPGTDALFSAMDGPLQGLGIAPAARGGDSGADLSPLRAAGVPVIELQQDASAYFDLHHSADDTADKLDAAALAQVTAAVAATAYGAAETPGDFGRIPAAERIRQ